MTSRLFFSSVLVLASFGFVACTGGSVEQPIAYNHKLHVEDADMACLDCHTSAKETARATIPNIGLCVDCHDPEDADSASAELKKLLAYISKQEKIPWQKVYRVDSHVYFSHARHTVAGKLDCDVCHGKVAEMTKPITRPAVKITMDRCMDCHEAQHVNNDCLWCHR